MMYALLDGTRQEASPRVATATCPTCGDAVIPKCGRVVVWHWSHRPAIGECDPWAEPDNHWHREWQLTVPKERREVRIGRHRADMVTPQGFVIEVQHSGIGVDEIRERESFYGSMAWIFDAREAYGQERLDVRVRRGHPDPTYRTFRWKHARKSIAACRKTVWLDLGPELLRLGRIWPQAPTGGWGHIHSREFVAQALNVEPQEEPA